MWEFLESLRDGAKSFYDRFSETSKAEGNRYGFDINTIRDYLWPVLTAVAINTQFKPTNDENDQTWAQLAYCAAVTAGGTLAWWLFLVKRYQQQGSSFKEACGQALEEFDRKNVVPALAGTLLAIPTYNWSGYAFDNYLADRGWNPYFATIVMASLATGYAEQGTQYFFITEINKVRDWYRQRSSGYEMINTSAKKYQPLSDFFNILADIAKTLFGSFISVRAIGSFYPGGMWNLVFMGLTIALGMTDASGNAIADTRSVAYWAKLLLLVAPSVAVSVRASNVLVTMSIETLEKTDGAIVEKVGELGSKIKECGSQLFFKQADSTETAGLRKVFTEDAHTSASVI